MLTIVCAGVVLASLDLFIVNVALPQIARDLHVRGNALADLSWVLNAYAIVYASLLVLLGRVAERFPREHGFLLGVATFTAASAACGLAGSLPMLIAFRIVQAAGAALLTPTSLGLILATYPAERRHGAVRAWSAVGGLAAAAGPSWAAYWSPPAGAGCSSSTCPSDCSRWRSAGVDSRTPPGIPCPRRTRSARC